MTIYIWKNGVWCTTSDYESYKRKYGTHALEKNIPEGFSEDELVLLVMQELQDMN